MSKLRDLGGQTYRQTDRQTDRPSYKNIKIWVVGVYVINERVKRSNLDNITHDGYFVGYTAITGFTIYWKPDQTIVIHRYHHVFSD